MAHRNQAQSRVSAFYRVADVVGSRLRKRGGSRATSPSARASAQEYALEIRLRTLARGIMGVGIALSQNRTAGWPRAPVPDGSLGAHVHGPSVDV